MDDNLPPLEPYDEDESFPEGFPAHLRAPDNDDESENSASSFAESNSELIDEPLEVPQSIRPPGSEQWTSGNKQSDLNPAEDKEFSNQSKQMINTIQEALDNDRCTQIDGYGPAKISVQFDGQNQLIDGVTFASESEYTDWLKNIVENSGAVIDWDKIEDDRMGVLELPGGERLCIFLPPLSRNYPTFSLRKHTSVQWVPKHFVDKGTVDNRMMGFLQRCLAAHVNILFVGQMGSGKTSLMRALTQSSVGDEEKMAIVEQVPELNINKPLATEYVYQPTVEGLGLGDVLDFNLYNGLSRLIVGEVHLDGITKMLETMILTEGSMSTYHAFSTEQAGERMKLALQIENSNISGETAVSFIRNAVELVVVLEKIDDRRRVMQISEIDWRSSSGREQLSGADIFAFDSAQDKFKAIRRPDDNGRIAAKLKKYNIEVPSNWFIEAEDLQRFRQSQ